MEDVKNFKYSSCCLAHWLELFEGQRFPRRREMAYDKGTQDLGLVPHQEPPRHDSCHSALGCLFLSLSEPLPLTSFLMISACSSPVSYTPAPKPLCDPQLGSLSSQTHSLNSKSQFPKDACSPSSFHFLGQALGYRS